MDYTFNAIEAKWRQIWQERNTYKVSEDSSKPKFYVLDMFPYPSGAGLHVGHPLGYIASDIFARYKRLKGFNVLHPMGYDSFGLPAEQYAIQTGQHPAITTKENIARYRQQLDLMGFSFDWDREVRTSEPSYYKWTQWIFKQLFDAYYDLTLDKATPITSLIRTFEQEGNINTNAVNDCEQRFDAAAWAAFSPEAKEAVLQQYRMAYLAESWVNWCPALGTVLANDEIITENFIKRINTLKTKPQRNKTYTPDMQETIYSYLEKNDALLLLFIKFISYNFLRPVEVCRLKVGDLDVKDKKLYVRAKNKLVKIKIIPEILIKDLPDLTQMNKEDFLFTPTKIGGQWIATENNRRDHFSKRFKSIVKDHFGLGSDYGMYSFRHTFITKLYRELRKSYSPFEAKSILMNITGHSTMSALELYLRDIDAELPEDYSHLLE